MSFPFGYFNSDFITKYGRFRKGTDGNSEYFENSIIMECPLTDIPLNSWLDVITHSALSVSVVCL